MDDTTTCVANWLSTLSYQELRKLAGEHAIKKKQKKQKLIGLLKKVIKNIPVVKDDVGEGLAYLQDGDHVVGERRKRPHSVIIGEENFPHASSTTLSAEVTEPKKKRICDEKTSSSRAPEKENLLDATFEITVSKNLGLSNLSSGSFFENVKEQKYVSNIPHETTWMSEDNDKRDESEDNQKSAEDDSFMTEISSKSSSARKLLSLSKSNEAGKEKKLRDEHGICTNGNQDSLSKDNEKSIASSPLEIEHYRKQVTDFDNKRNVNLEASSSTNAVSVQSSLADLKSPGYRTLTAQFAAKHKQLFQKETNIEEDAKRIQELYEKHEKEVPLLFKRLATPKRRKCSNIPVPVRNSINQSTADGYDFSQASGNLSKMSFNFGTLTSNNSGDKQKPCNISGSVTHSVLRLRNQSVPLASKVDKSGDVLPNSHASDLVEPYAHFVKNRTPERRSLTDRKGSSHGKVIPFVDTLTMSDAQFEMAKKEGKIPSFIERNRKSVKLDRKLLQ